MRSRRSTTSPTSRRATGSTSWPRTTPGGGGGYSQGLHDAITRAANQNILFVAAAGNDGTDNDTTARYPCNYDTTQGTKTQAAATYNSVIAVAALRSDGALGGWVTGRPTYNR